MPVTSITSDISDLTITVTAEYSVPVARLWEGYSDPRQLEKFWGPVEWPATFTRHDMAVGGESHYAMRGPDGMTSRGAFRFLRVVPERLIEVQDVFIGEDGQPNLEMPSLLMTFVFEATASGSRFTSVTTLPSAASLEQLLAMGMLEGTQSAMSQIDAVLADDATFAATRPTMAQVLSETQVRVSRVIRAPQQAVWRAHRDATLLPRWLLGPDGWQMPVCEPADAVGDTYRFEWATTDGTERFGFTGTLLESAPPAREVTTEQLLGTDGPATRNELTLIPVPAGTLAVLVITYPTTALRDYVLASGMTNGMERSYQRLERDVLALA